MPAYITLVSFDALHTLLAPAKPVHAQYADVLAPFLGVLSPPALARSFKASLRHVQSDKPAYRAGAHRWWSEVVRRTAIGAGADPLAVDASLHHIVPRLMHRFSSAEGYRLFDDTLPVLRQLQQMNVRIALVSNSDARMRLVLADLGISPFFHALSLSEEERIEKPHPDMFRRAFSQAVGTTADIAQGVHVGDDLHCDYHGARSAGMQALLIRRPSPDGDQEHKQPDEDLEHVDVVSSLHGVVDWVASRIPV